MGQLKNPRQIPKVMEICANKDYSDILYAWLQCESDFVAQGMDRRIPKAKIKWTAIERALTLPDGAKIMGRKTIAKYFAWLLESGLVYVNDTDEDNYYLKTLINTEQAWLVEASTLRKLINTQRSNTISVYVFLLMHYVTNACEAFEITISQIKNFIGLSNSSRNNNTVVVDILEMLKRLGLLDFKKEYDGSKWHYTVLWVRNQLPDI